MPSALTESVHALLWIGLPVVAGYAVWQLHFRRYTDGEAKASTLARGLSLVGIFVTTAPMMCLVVGLPVLSVVGRLHLPPHPLNTPPLLRLL